jgi:hypothetical protein
MDRRTIFKSERNAWLAVCLYTIVLYSTLTLAFDLYVSIYGSIGKSSMSSAINLAFAAIGALLIIWTLMCVRPRLSGYLALVMIFLAIAFCLHHLSIPAKRFHFLQYGPLALLVFDSISFRCRKRDRYIWTIALVALIGLGDETIQLLLPDRHFGILDVVINTVAGMLTLVFIGFVWGDENYPKLRRSG